MEWRTIIYLKRTHEITMIVSAYRIKHFEEQNIKLIITDFTKKILKEWWDNYLSLENKIYITQLA